MDVYGGGDYFRIDDLLDFSNEDIFSSATTTTAHSADNHLSPPPTSSSFDPFTYPQDFSDPLSLPSDDVAELEWLSRFVDDSFTDFPPNLIAGTINIHSTKPKRSRSTTAKKQPNTSSSPPCTEPQGGGGVPRCSHCASEKTPQWRTGPLGPKTLCNACGVRYKSGRLVPEYRPAASPTFVLTQHSNSHRKVMELRRQKEMLKQQQPHQEFRVC